MSDTKDFYDNLTALAKELENLRAERVHDLNQIGGLQEENARLKAEVERLTKAGDAMAEEMGLETYAEEHFKQQKEFLKAWNAAKEGKPSV
jgi:regulator of replication initiation timing